MLNSKFCWVSSKPQTTLLGLNWSSSLGESELSMSKAKVTRAFLVYIPSLESSYSQRVMPEGGKKEDSINLVWVLRFECMNRNAVILLSTFTCIKKKKCIFASFHISQMLRLWISCLRFLRLIISYIIIDGYWYFMVEVFLLWWINLTNIFLSFLCRYYPQLKLCRLIVSLEAKVNDMSPLLFI